MFAIIIPMLLGRQRRYKMVYYDLRIEKQRIYGADKIAIAADALVLKVYLLQGLALILPVEHG